MPDYNQYGCAARKALCLIIKHKRKGKDISPIEAWEKAVTVLFPNSESSRNKGCPKAAFLGLCGVGLVKNVCQGSYTQSIKNRNYALMLRTDQALGIQ